MVSIIRQAQHDVILPFYHKKPEIGERTTIVLMHLSRFFWLGSLVPMADPDG
jgi:hypothetical protein